MEVNNQEFLLHERCCRILAQYHPEADADTIVKCCDEWLAKGNKIPAGVLKYFQAYFLNQ